MKQGEWNQDSRRRPGRSPERGARLFSRAGGVLCAALSLALVVGVTGCSSPAPKEEPRIDMTTDETAKVSLEKVRASLTQQQQRALAGATSALLQREVQANPDAMKDPIKARALLVRILDGKTAAQVISEASALPKQGGGAPAAAPKGAG